jgi:hypothetical protein
MINLRETKYCKTLFSAEGAMAINSQAKESNFDDTLESKGAPKKQCWWQQCSTDKSFR